MDLLTQSDKGLSVDPTRPLGRGGEACVYAVSAELVAKVYHQPTTEHEQKLKAMIKTPPQDPMAQHQRRSIAWPVDLLYTKSVSRRFVGFLMPRVDRAQPIVYFFSPLLRQQHYPTFDWRCLHRTARNLASAFVAIHERGYVIGDVNERNAVVAIDSIVTLLDTDSFQVRDRSGVVYRCRVWTPRYTPPELLKKVSLDADRTPEHDLFGMGVLLFQLLMEGTHPFSGVFLEKGDPPPEEVRIQQGHFPYARKKTPYRPMPKAPPFDILSPALQALFRRCFEDGHTAPDARPDARTWVYALQEAEDALRQCSTNPQHHYAPHVPSCPWCTRARILRRPVLPAPQIQIPLPAYAARPRPVGWAVAKPRPAGRVPWMGRARALVLWASARRRALYWIATAAVVLTSLSFLSRSWRSRPSTEATVNTTPIVLAPSPSTTPTVVHPSPEGMAPPVVNATMSPQSDASRYPTPVADDGMKTRQSSSRAITSPLMPAPPATSSTIRTPNPTPLPTPSPTPTPSLSRTPPLAMDCRSLSEYSAQVREAYSVLQTLSRLCRKDDPGPSIFDGMHGKKSVWTGCRSDDRWNPALQSLGLTPEDFVAYCSLDVCLRSARGEFHGIACHAAAGNPFKYGLLARAICSEGHVDVYKNKWQVANDKLARCRRAE